MIKHEVIVCNKLGVHARPAALIAQVSNKFNAEIWLDKDGISANAKSIMSVMMLAAACKTTLTIRAQGPDENQAVEALVQLFDSRFNEQS